MARRAPEQYEVDRVFFLLLVFGLLLVVLSVALYVGALFFQNYFNTEPTRGLAWRAPAAAGTMAVFFTLWCFIITRSDVSGNKLPYDAIHRFSPRIDMFETSAPKLWVIRSDGSKTLYLAQKREDGRIEYKDERRKTYNASGVVAYEFDNHGAIVRLENGVSEGAGKRTFTSADGWVMQEFDTIPTGMPTQSRWGRFLANIGLNLLHAVLWFVCFWLLLQFRFNDALGFAFVISLVATLILLPMLLDQAADVAKARIAAGT